ncbi:MAG: pyridoxal-phosphate dependent enzyme, partial [Candidatus Bathyarchaeia archaeon]
MEFEVKCALCGRSPVGLVDYRCSCGSPLKTTLYMSFDKRKIKKRDYSLWRYKEFFPYIAESEKISLGEGWTPLVKLSKSLFFKMDHLNPTGSFKDRGSTVLISALHKLVREAGGYISEDSSG